MEKTLNEVEKKALIKLEKAIGPTFKFSQNFEGLGLGVRNNHVTALSLKALKKTNPQFLSNIFELIKKFEFVN